MSENLDIESLQSALEEARAELAKLVKITERKLALYEKPIDTEDPSGGDAKTTVEPKAKTTPSAEALELAAANARFGSLRKGLGLLFSEIMREIPAERFAQILVYSRIFDKHYYLSSNPDVANDGIDPLTHYVFHGIQEHRSPCALFEGGEEIA